MFTRRYWPFWILCAALIARLFYIDCADLWIDEVATLHHSVNWDLATMQKYSVHSGYYGLLQLLSGNDPQTCFVVAHLLSLVGLVIAWWCLKKQLEERNEDPFWPQVLLLIWPSLFVFSSAVRPYSFVLGWFFMSLWLLNTQKVQERKRLLGLFFSIPLSSYCLYLCGLLYIPLVLLSNRKNLRNNILLCLAIPLVFYKATLYVLKQTILDAPLISSTGQHGNYWNPLWEGFVLFNWPFNLALVLALVLMVLFLVGSWWRRDFFLWLGCLVALCSMLQLTEQSSFPRHSLFFLPFFIPGIIQGAKRLLGSYGPLIVVLLVLVCLPYSLSRSVKVNGSKQVKKIVESQYQLEDTIVVFSGHQGVPLHYLLSDSEKNFVVFYDSKTVPEFFGVPRRSIAYSHDQYIQMALAKNRIWVWGHDQKISESFQNWPLVQSWAINSGGNGSRLLELRQKP